MNNFKDYGFEADFEGEILSDIEDYYIGYYIETYPCVKEKQKIPTFWNKYTGNCYAGAGVSNSKYTLKLIKKEWYENPDNIGKAIIIEEERLAILKGGINRTVVCIDIQHNAELSINVEKCRPATKEEALALLVKE